MSWKKTGWIVGAASAVAAVVAFAANVTTVAGWFGVGPEGDGGGESPATSVAAKYVADCEADGYSREQCERSRDLDPSSAWTGELYEDEEPEPTGGGETSEDPGPSEYDVYLEECQYFGYTQDECATSWDSDPGTTWTGQLYPLSEQDAYMLDCQNAGYAWEDCDTSWRNDPSNVWTGQLYGPSEQEVYLEDCQNAGYNQDACDTSWYNDPGNVWTGQLY
ncbi:hypothetical protein [Glycomyces paridis]|uniref:Uncharacterized protein n=1 Tax=Glycomyces paridis TaxID=2126555 RepID=A0A4S8PAR5_9ACTN|nr:hypothetical protein [Glycomyces paridis]THV26811.1 hypothetical protein E9998_17655 [Glycomyces paridis]